MAYQKIYMNQIYSSSLLCQLSQMWQRDILCDAVMQAGSTTVKAHRVVLVAACPMLQSMDGASSGNKLEVVLSSDIQQESLTEFLRYLYDGFMMLTEDNVRDIEKIGRLLQVDSVTKCCADFFKVLQSQAGQNASYNPPKFCFHADQAEFRHVRASDLLRSMQNGSEKRSGEGDGFVLRKKTKSKHPPVSIEDHFEVIQIDSGEGNTVGNRVCQSLAVSVASKSEPAQPSVQVIDVANGQSTIAKQPIVLEAKHPPTKGSDEKSSGRPMVSLLSGSKTNKTLSLTPTFTPSEPSNQSKGKKGLTVPHQKSSTKTRADDEVEQIIIQPMEDEDIFITDSLNTDSPEEFDLEPNDEDKLENRGDSPVSLEDTGQTDDAEHTSSMNLKVVKIEKVNVEDESSSYTGQFEDYSYVEDEGSDTETGYADDAGQGTSDGPTWYIQTFKDHLRKHDEDPAFEDYTDFDLDKALVRFYRAANLPPEELRKFPIRLSQYLNASPYYRNINIRRDVEFEDSNSAMHQAMYGSFQAEEIRRKRPMSQGDLNKLYDSGVLSNDNPTSLQNKVWVELMIYIGGLSRQDLRNLEKDHFIFEKDDNGSLFFHIDSRSIATEKKKIRVFEQPDNLNCPVQSLWLYLSKLNPNSPVFFQQPLKENIGADDPVWYSSRPIGKNAHSSWLAAICKEAGVTTEYRNQALYCRTTPVKESRKIVFTPKK